MSRADFAVTMPARGVPTDYVLVQYVRGSHVGSNAMNPNLVTIDENSRPFRLPNWTIDARH